MGGQVEHGVRTWTRPESRLDVILEMGTHVGAPGNVRGQRRDRLEGKLEGAGSR